MQQGQSSTASLCSKPELPPCAPFRGSTRPGARCCPPCAVQCEAECILFAHARWKMNRNCSTQIELTASRLAHMLDREMGTERETSNMRCSSRNTSREAGMWGGLPESGVPPVPTGKGEHPDREMEYLEVPPVSVVASMRSARGPPKTGPRRRPPGRKTRGETPPPPPLPNSHHSPPLLPCGLPVPPCGNPVPPSMQLAVLCVQV